MDTVCWHVLVCGPVSDAIHRAQETVQESLKTLKRTQENHKSLLHDINKLMNRAMDLGLKSKVRYILIVIL